MAQNEQFAESITRKLMQFDVGQNNKFYAYPQSVDKTLVEIKNCLDKAGGKPKDCALTDFSVSAKGTAKPEYIITYDENPNTILVVECKRNKKDHVSIDLSHPQKYAVDGVLYYTKYLKDKFNVIAVAVSGTKVDDYYANAYYWKQGELSYTELEKTKDILLSPINYLNLLESKKLVKKFSVEEIKQLANKYNNIMRELNIIPQERIMFIASCLLALQNDFFAKTYNMSADNSALVETLITNVEIVLKNNKIPDKKIQQICANARLIKNYQKMLELSPHKAGSLIYFLKQLELVIIPMINDSNSHQDALGIFYHEFIKYTAGNAGNELGIVLTPEHLCDFMCEVANLNINDTVIDIACGTGSFLVSAMKHLIVKATNVEQIKKIKDTQLYGVEFQPNIYSIAITNMILRGDGQSNIYNEDCFKFTVPNHVNFSVGLLNPPYSQKSEVELNFVKKMLDLLTPRGIGVVVVPMSCAIGTKFKEERKSLFANHTLKAVFSMPDDIFYPVGTNVCVMVWEAHIPHDSTSSTFFGYYKDDGFIKKKNLGRVDFNNKWKSIKEEWLYLYRKNQEVTGKTALKCITANDEWLCEAYMDTDYSNLTYKNFEQTIRDFLSYQIRYRDIIQIQNNIGKVTNNIDMHNWHTFVVGEIFQCETTKHLIIDDMLSGEVPFISRTANNNGVECFVDMDISKQIEGNCITIGAEGRYAFYQTESFVTGVKVYTLRHKKLNKYNAMFICTILNQEVFRYSYGRARIINLIKLEKITLPANSQNEPDWEYMEKYIKLLPYGDCV